MRECIHNHLTRAENMPAAYVCDTCGTLFEVQLYKLDNYATATMGTPQGSQS